MPRQKPRPAPYASTERYVRAWRSEPKALKPETVLAVAVLSVVVAGNYLPDVAERFRVVFAVGPGALVDPSFFSVLHLTGDQSRQGVLTKLLFLAGAQRCARAARPQALIVSVACACACAGPCLVSLRLSRWVGWLTLNKVLMRGEKLEELGCSDGKFFSMTLKELVRFHQRAPNLKRCPALVVRQVNVAALTGKHLMTLLGLVPAAQKYVVQGPWIEPCYKVQLDEVNKRILLERTVYTSI